MRRRLMVTTIALAIVVALGFADQLSSGQQRFPESNRKPACGCYVCGLLLAVEFPNKDPKCYGILSADACTEEIAKLPAETRKAFCQRLTARSKGKSLDACLVLRHACETGEDPLPKRCDPPRTPWFNPDGNCRDAQAWEIKQAGGTVTASICGHVVFKNSTVGTDPLFSAAYIGALRDWLRGSTGDKVCCDEFRSASRTAVPCDPRKDIDCDGKPNVQDHDGNVPTIQMFGSVGPPDVDSFPPGFSVSDIYPTAATCKDCQWVLVKGELKCNVAIEGGTGHIYQAKWRCPSTGVEVDTHKSAPATAPCAPPVR